MKNIKFISLRDLFRDTIKSEPMVSLNNSIELLALSSRLGWRVSLAIFGRQGRTSFRLRQIHNFFNYILRMNRKHGGKYVVSYLKFSQLAIQKAIAGNKLESLRELDPSLSLRRLTSSGFPRYIPLHDRRAMKSGSTSVIRFWLTLFAVYRIVNIPGKLKLGTITDPFSGNKKGYERVSRELATLVENSKRMFRTSILKSDPGMLLLETSSPTTKVSWLGIFNDPYLLAKAGLGQVMLDYMNELGYSRLLSIWTGIFKYYKLVEKCSILSSKFELPGGTRLWDQYKVSKVGTLPRVGQLSRKLEPAGKVRVFAMVDIWTQSILSPLHNMLTDFLASLPNDGTKDQVASWKRAAEKSKCGRSFGYDLSAATDRLPIDLQKVILSKIIGKKVTDLWSQLMVGRDYYLAWTDEEILSFKKQCEINPALFKESVNLSPGLGNGTAKVFEDGSYTIGAGHGVNLRYAVGQPMGALSSFNMLAVTHHFLVQLAYQRSLPFYKKMKIILLFGEFQWYSNYEITGDDLVLFDADVAQEYLQIMNDIGVPINATKSVVASIPCVEYLKVTTLRAKNISALSWKMLISNNSFMGRINSVYTLLDRAYIGNTGIINWLGDMTCQSIGKGNINLTLFSVINKYHQEGKLSLANVFESIIDKSDLTKSLKSNIIKGTNKAYMSLIVSNLINNKTDLRLRKSEYSKEILHWITEYMKHKLKINISVFNDSKDLSLEIINYLFPDEVVCDPRGTVTDSEVSEAYASHHKRPVYPSGKLPKVQLGPGFYQGEDSFVWENTTLSDESRYHQTVYKGYNEEMAFNAMKVSFYQLIWDEVFFPLFNRLSRPIPYKASLEEIFETTESIDRYWEVKSILARADDKISKKIKIEKKPKFTMNLVTSALKAMSWKKELENKKLVSPTNPVDGLKIGDKKLFRVVNNLTGEVRWV